MLSFSLLALSILPRLDGPVCESVDLVEVNHFHDENARPLRQQNQQFHRQALQAYSPAFAPYLIAVEIELKRHEFYECDAHLAQNSTIPAVAAVIRNRVD